VGTTNNQAQCINQLDVNHKQAQIELMGRIYSESQLVIIAAAGDSSSHGLPGVGRKSRRPQRRVEVDGSLELIEQPDAQQDLDSSIWASRGWTLQEGYLAPRRLVFTENEVFYVCGQASWQESVQRPSLDCKSFFLGLGDARFPPLHDYDQRQDMSPMKDVMMVLSSFSTRNLSFESDILNACIGILDKRVRCHYWGMPVEFSDDEAQSVLSLRWRSSEPGKRRDGFPSWSWVAITGPKEITSAESMEATYVAQTRAVDGTWISHDPGSESRCDVLPTGYGPTLRLTGRFYTAYLVISHEHSTPFVAFRHGDNDDTRIAFALSLDTQLIESDLGNKLKLVPVETSWIYPGPKDMWDCVNPPTFVVFQAVGDHYKRLGITGERYFTHEMKTGSIVWKEYDFHEFMAVQPRRKRKKEHLYIE